MTTLRRRRFIRHAAQLAAAAALGPQLIPIARAADSCTNPDSEALRVSVSYVAKAADATQSCATCGFFGADDAKPACGGCQIMGGPVDATGHCDSWSPKA
jgi:anaerobic selenocysteine-containing dehydrogenase